MGQQVLDIKHSFDIIACTGINRDTGVGIINYALKHVFKRSTYIKIHYIQTGSHNLFGRLPAKTDNSFKNIVFFRKFGFICQFKGMGKFINRDIMIFLGEVFI